MVSEEKAYKECGWQKDGDGRTDNGVCLQYKLTYEPKGLSELKEDTYIYSCKNTTTCTHIFTRIQLHLFLRENNCMYSHNNTTKYTFSQKYNYIIIFSEENKYIYSHKNKSMYIFLQDSNYIYSHKNITTYFLTRKQLYIFPLEYNYIYSHKNTTIYILTIWNVFHWRHNRHSSIYSKCPKISNTLFHSFFA